MAKQQIDLEEWRDIPGFDGYQASSLGRLKSYHHKAPRILKIPKPDKHGYLSYGLRRNASRAQPHKKTFLAHRLVALAFTPNPCNKPFINHKNGIKGDCRPDNLEWCTKPENGRHAVETGLHTALRGESNGNSSLTKSDVREIRAKYASGRYTHHMLAVEYHVGRTTICYIVNGRLWGHVKTKGKSKRFDKIHAVMKSERLSSTLKGREGKKGESHPRAKLDTKSVLEIRSKFKPRVYTKAMLADEYKVSRATIKAILRRRLWSHV